MDKKELKEHISNLIQKNGEWTMFADGLDEAIIGVDASLSRIIYSVAKCYDILIQRDGMSQEEAEEFFAFKVLGSFMGEKTPIWCYDIFKL